MSLGILVGRFGDFVREQNPPAEPVPAPFPSDLKHIHETAGHHVVLLALLARADGETAASEKDVIVTHCLAFANAAGHSVSDAERAALADYVSRFRPALMQLDPALKRLAHDSKADIAALFAAAQAVVDADGVRRPAEVRLLAELREDLARL
jgi:hypothetical protein